ncbi:MAG TPA: hypothetical protein DHW45_15760 [Candidatus Latescibacteria bacterium]|nr:hypothetical protein [Candidatus Latescibacterota bacterium]
MAERVNELIDLVESSSTLPNGTRTFIFSRNIKASENLGRASLYSIFRVHLYSRIVREPRRLVPVQETLGPDLYFLKPPCIELT